MTCKLRVMSVDTIGHYCSRDLHKAIFIICFTFIFPVFRLSYVPC